MEAVGEVESQRIQAAVVEPPRRAERRLVGDLDLRFGMHSLRESWERTTRGNADLVGNRRLGLSMPIHVLAHGIPINTTAGCFHGGFAQAGRYIPWDIEFGATARCHVLGVEYGGNGEPEAVPARYFDL